VEGGGAGSPGRAVGRVVARNASPARAPPRARWAASDSTLRTASSSDSRSRVISDSLKGGCTLRSCAISAARARSYSARRLSPGALGPVRRWRGQSAGSNSHLLLNNAGFPVTSR